MHTLTTRKQTTGTRKREHIMYNKQRVHPAFTFASTVGQLVPAQKEAGLSAGQLVAEQKDSITCAHPICGSTCGRTKRRSICGSTCGRTNSRAVPDYRITRNAAQLVEEQQQQKETAIWSQGFLLTSFVGQLVPVQKEAAQSAGQLVAERKETWVDILFVCE